MNKLLVGLAAVLAATFAPLTAHAALKVVTTTQDLAAITQDIGGANVEVSYIARGDLDPHFVDAKPSYMVKLASANLVECVGMDLEVGWLPSLITGARNPRIQPGTPGYLDVSVGIKAIEVPSGTIDRSRGDLHAAGNPHYWLDPENGRGMARTIQARLAQLDPAHAADYQKNLAAFETRLAAKQAEWTAKMAPLRGTAVVGYHSTFDYFIARYGLNLVGFVEPKPGIPPTPSHTLELAGKAKAAGVRFVFIEPFHSANDALPIANAAGAKVLPLPSSVGAEADIATYFDLFDHLVRALTGK
ncbi:MAG: metal ABC transporter substrate-binding protein [Pseudomonadota bacterium]|nr:metal ABC transporter substrate-binding protein [Pseudomonadota bacterium]